MTGVLRIGARMRDGIVSAVEICSPRVDPSAVFIGRDPEQAVALAGRLFSLCPMAQATAARAATGLPAAENEARALLAERLAEMLRASLLDWPGAPAPPEEIAALRDVLALLRRSADEAGAQCAAALRDALARLGLGAPRGFCARQMAEALADECAMKLRPRKLDALTPDDDLPVVEGLWADKAFSRAPALPGRRVETGVAARRGVQGALAARLAAREAEMIETGAAIAAVLEGAPAPKNLVARGAGFAAVECARGRLYHACRLDGDGRISDYRIVAPTEWNFHPDGPFARLLTGALIGAGAEAKRRVERLAFVFDPCIRAQGEITEPAHA
jgi:bacterioferritin-associated ferredoxin